MKAVVLGGLAAACLGLSGARAGEVDGPGTRVRVIGPRAEQAWELEMVGGEVAVVGVTGDGGTDLDLVVEDAKGRVVARSAGPTDVEEVRWRPPCTQAYRVKVINRSRTTANRYVLRWN